MQYEYQIIDSAVDGNPDSEFELNELGKEGWQLVGILPQINRTRFYFMRFVVTISPLFEGVFAHSPHQPERKE